jgi:O-antigen/teichoic acid export membrane protein
MNRTQKIAKNFKLLAGAQGITWLLGLTLIALIGRRLGETGFGEYAFCISVAMIFLVVSDLGVTGVVVRDVAADTSLSRKYLANMLGLQSFLCLLAALLAILSTYLLQYPRDIRTAIWFFAGGMAFFSLSGSFRAIFWSHQAMEYEAALRVLESLLILLLSLLVLASGYGLVGLSIAYFVTHSLIFLSSLLIAQRRFVKVEIKLELEFWKKILGTSIFFALSGLFWTIYYRIDIVMLSLMDGSAVVGLYNAAYSIMHYTSKAPVLLGFVLFPVISELHQSSPGKLKELFNKMFIYLLMFGILGATLLFLFSGKIIPLIFGEKFSKSIPSMQILSWTIVFLFPTHLLSNTLHAVKQHKMFALIAGGGAVFNIILNLILIPIFSLMGAAIATLLTEGLVAVSSFIWLARSLELRIPKKFLRILLSFALMLVGIRVTYHYGSYIAAGSGTILYLLTLYFTKCIVL